MEKALGWNIGHKKAKIFNNWPTIIQMRMDMETMKNDLITRCFFLIWLLLIEPVRFLNFPCSDGSLDQLVIFSVTRHRAARDITSGEVFAKTLWRFGKIMSDEWGWIAFNPFYDGLGFVDFAVSFGVFGTESLGMCETPLEIGGSESDPLGHRMVDVSMSI